MKIQADERIINPFNNKLYDTRMMLEDLIFALQVGFILGVLCAIIGYIVSTLNLILDIKTRILEAWKGIFREFRLDKLECVHGAQFPGFVISQTVCAFALTVIGFTIIFTLLIWPMFWRILWALKYYILTILIPSIINWLIEGYVEDFIYERYYCKKRYLAGFLDIVHFYLSVLEGIGAAVARIRNGIIYLIIAQQWINEPAMPNWILKLWYGDEFHLTFMGFVYMVNAHNHPIMLTAADYLIESVNQKRMLKYLEFWSLKNEDEKKKFVKDYETWIP